MSLPGKGGLSPKPLPSRLLRGRAQPDSGCADPTAAAANRVAQEGLTERVAYPPRRPLQRSLVRATGSVVDGVRRGSSGMVIAFAGHASTQARHLVHFCPCGP